MTEHKWGDGLKWGTPGVKWGAFKRARYRITSFFPNFRTEQKVGPGVVGQLRNQPLEVNQSQQVTSNLQSQGIEQHPDVRVVGELRQKEVDGDVL